MDPISFTSLILAIISAIGVSILAIIKVIKRSSCFYGCCSCTTRNDEVEPLTKNNGK